MNRIFSMGEALVDVFGNEVHAGGAPANVAVCCARLGAESYFIGGISVDKYGEFLFNTLRENGVKTDCIKRNRFPTAEAHVTLKDGERYFEFLCDGTADLDIPVWNDFKKGDVLHFCSVAARSDMALNAHKKIIKCAKEAGAIVSFDVNLRFGLWKDREKLRETCLDFMEYADVLKLSDDETEFFGGVDNILKIAHNAKLVVITRGKAGADGYFNGEKLHVCGRKVMAIDATGAGDCFCGCLLFKIAKDGLKSENFPDYLEFATKGAACAVEKIGAIEGMPYLTDIH